MFIYMKLQKNANVSTKLETILIIKYSLTFKRHELGIIVQKN